MKALLEDRAVIALSGPEARDFLQGLITNDIAQLAPGKGLYAALLTPQGKILFDFLIAEGDGAVLLDVAASARDALLKRLTMYRLRAKVEIEARDQLAVLVGLEGRPAERGITFADPRLAALGRRTIGARAEMPSDVADGGDYRAHRIDLGVPEGIDFGSDKIFALDAGLEELHGVSFTKGCYIGQELTARMKHKSTARKRLLPIESSGELPCAGTPLKAGTREIGEIMSAYADNRGFALIRLDRLEEAGGAPVEAGGVAVSVIKPSWLFA
jgi:hypothetical protein